MIGTYFAAEYEEYLRRQKIDADYKVRMAKLHQQVRAIQALPLRSALIFQPAQHYLYQQVVLAVCGCYSRPRPC